jgi:hypothetical protein
MNILSKAKILDSIIQPMNGICIIFMMMAVKILLSIRYHHLDNMRGASTSMIGTQ